MTIDEQQARLRKILEQRGITDPKVLEAIETVRRDLFVPEELQNRAYEDEALPIGEGQTITQPYLVALMTQELQLDGGETVLEVGTGSGYQAAIVARLCRQLVTIERFAVLSERARQVLEEQSYGNIRFAVGDGTLGCPEYGPYDGILVTAAAPDVPAPLYRQLKAGGRLIMPIGEETFQMLQVIEKGLDERPITHELCECRFVKLVGEAGWPDESFGNQE